MMTIDFTRFLAPTVLCVALLLPLPASAIEIRTEAVSVRAESVAQGLEHPWGLAFLPDGSAVVTERPGRIRLLSPQGSLSAPIGGVPQVAAAGQGGLLDIAAAPDFAQSRLVYISYSEPGPGGAGTAVARARLVDDGNPRLEGLEVVFSMARKTGTRQHFGSRLVFHPDGTLFITTGDRGEPDRSQDMRDHAGAVIRINPDGSVPGDNPSPDGSAHLPEIWSKGHRNPQGAVYDPVSAAVWTIEHGPRGGDALHRPEAGRNYGWPVITHGRAYSGGAIGVGTEADGYEQPVLFWVPSFAPSGLAVYTGSMFPEWQGDFLTGGLRSQKMIRIVRDDRGAITGQEDMFTNAFGRIRDVNVAPDGSVWLLTDDPNGRIIRLSRAG